jgi:hypothetical protein
MSRVAASAATAGAFLAAYVALEWPIVIGVGAITSLSYAFVANAARRHLHLDVGLIHFREVLMLLAGGLAGAANSA